MNQQGEAIKHLKTEHEKLQNETENLGKQGENLGKQGENLGKQGENLNQTIQLIQKFNTFLIDKHCTSSECLLCQTGWIFFRESCYFLGDVDLNWDGSRLYCQFKSADLIVINDQQEQEFIHGNIKTIYWLGLRKVEDNWVWVDGRNDTLEFWYGSNPYSFDSYATVDPSGNPTKNWASWSSSITGYPLCEQKAFKVSLN